MLALTLVLVVAALLGSTGLVVDQLRRTLVQQLDERVHSAAVVAQRLLGLEELIGEGRFPARDTVEQEGLRDLYAARLGADGQVESLIRPAAGAPPALPRLDSAAVGHRGGEPFTVDSLHGSEQWRVVALPSGAGSVVTAGSLGEVDGAMRRLTGRVLLIDGAVLGLVGVAGWFAVRAGLRPLRRVETTAAAIVAGDLSSRVPALAAPRTELGSLSASLNTMLDRIEAGDNARAEVEQSMRRFIADVSHELRTPLAGIKGFTELYRMGGMPGTSDVDAAMSRIERESARLVDLVEELLLLARLDERGASAAQTLQRTPMDLRTLAADALRDLTALDPARHVTLTGPGGGPPGGAPVVGDEARLRQVMSNLVGNVIAHTPVGTAVRIGVGTSRGQAILELSDQGPGMTAEQAARAFDRFYRADTGRRRTRSGGAGLGLSISHSLVTIHGGRVEVDTAPGQGATFRIVLPLYTENPGA
ncbi:sensor histidine kinase [Streptomyces tagetis]|uniref:sensor histidine kinase n=1 Tax=Streptomyces tagetis TaxID=2820809 RepID=UPI0027DC3E7E|nr:HAMP domain-containing sensor histidine kinase [Streptomyces sp. RG38]